MSGRAPLFVPAVPRPRLRDEPIRPVAPWFARSGPVTDESAPAIVNFSDDGFVESFFQAVGDSRETFDPALWPKRNAWRDYAEPPRACKDAAGAPRYDTAVIRRAPVTRDVAENTVDPAAADPVAAAETAEWSRDPDSGRRASPLPWFRKLYHPIHEQFPVVTVELLCDRFGWLPVEGSRVVEVGMVVRRLVRDATPGERWQDWVVGAEGKGAWVEIADAQMKLPGGAVIDPAKVTIPTNEPALRGRIGLSGTQPLALETQMLGPIPRDVGLGAKHTGYFGLLALSSAATEGVGEADDPARYAAIAGELGASAKRAIEREIGAQAPSLSTQIAALVASLASALLPPSTVSDVDAALLNAQTDTGFAYGLSFGYATAGQRVIVLRRVVNELVRRVWAALWNAAPTDRNHATADSPASWWAAAWPAATAGYASPIGGLEGAWKEWMVQNHAALLEPIVLAVLRSGVRTDADPRFSWSAEAGLTAMGLVVLTRRLRAYRLEILDAIYSSEMPAGTYDPSILDKKRPDGTPIVTTAAPGAEISAWLDAVHDPASALPSLSPIPGSPDLDAKIAAHRIGGQLERLLFEAERACLGAGGPFAELLRSHLAATVPTLETWLGPTTLKQAGLDVYEQPLRGLLGFPTWNPAFPVGATTVVGAFAGEVQAAWTAMAPAAPSTPATDPFAWEDLRKTLRARRETRLPRFDSDNLYAVWVFTRVTPRDPCLPQIVAWSRRTEPFAIAEPLDVLGLRPVNVRLPDLQNLMRDIPRIGKARALPFAAVTSGPGCGIVTGETPEDTARDCGIAMICSFGIPVFTLCAWIMFSIIFNILLILPGFAWMLLLKFCLPIPRVNE